MPPVCDRNRIGRICKQSTSVYCFQTRSCLSVHKSGVTAEWRQCVWIYFPNTNTSSGRQLPLPWLCTSYQSPLCDGNCGSHLLCHATFIIGRSSVVTWLSYTSPLRTNSPYALSKLPVFEHLFITVLNITGCAVFGSCHPPLPSRMACRQVGIQNCHAVLLSSCLCTSGGKCIARHACHANGVHTNRNGGGARAPCMQTGPFHCLIALGPSPFANSLVYGWATTHTC
jgi:hypothetical protein